VNLGLDWIEGVQFAAMFFTILFYVIAYYLFMSRRLDHQFRRLGHVRSKRSHLIKTYGSLNRLTYLMLCQRRPKISLTTGALLVLVSLFLSTAASCGGTEGFVRKPGYTLLKSPGGPVAELDWRLNQLERAIREPEFKPEETAWHDPGGGWWISTVVQPKRLGLYWENAIHNLGRYAYIFGNGLALATVLVVLMSFAKRLRYLCSVLQRVLFALSVLLSFVVVVDFAFNAYWFKDEMFLISNVFWIVPAAVLICEVLRQRTSARRRRSFVAKQTIFILMLPLILSAAIYVFYVTTKGFFGVLTYFLGVNLLSVTYLKIIRTSTAISGP
jgi:hypothetical protein